MKIHHILFLASSIFSVHSFAAPPDFSGVYFPVSPKTAIERYKATKVQERAGIPPPPLTATSPIADGSLGRSPNDPQLTPEYMKKWEAIRDSRITGSYETDYFYQCLPDGMPGMMSAGYSGMEIMQNKDKITVYAVHNDSYRRIFLDGRKAQQKHLDDPTYAGYSTGHWEGDTLVVDTVAITLRTYLEGSNFTPHSDKLSVRERIRFVEKDLLENHITVNDPVALVKPWETTHRLRRVKPKGGLDELRELACPEGLADERYGVPKF